MKTFAYLFFVLLVWLPDAPCYAHTNTSVFTENTPPQIQRVRLNITTPLGFTRHLLLGFTPDNAASDGFDYGYDAQNIDNYSNDCNWIIEDNRYVIQGVGAFDAHKAYPLGLFLNDSGNVAFALWTLENFDEPIDVYIFDALNNTFNAITDTSYTETLSEGNYVNRFYITFTNNTSLLTMVNNSQLSTEHFQMTSIDVSYSHGSKELKVTANRYVQIESIKLYSILGQKVQGWANLNSDQNGSLRVSLSGVSAGTYIANITTNGQKISKRLIITK